MSASIEFRAPRPEALSVKRGRPAKFTAEMQAALADRPGEFGVIQTGVKSASRISVLRREHAGFEFVGEKQEDGTLTVFARVPAPVEAPKPARKRASRAKGPAVKAPAAE